MKNKLILILTILLTGCDAFEAHPYDGKIKGETDHNATNIAKIEKALENKKHIRFAFLSDTQRRYDDTRDAVKTINAMKDIDFIIHGGDLTDFSQTMEYILMRDILNKLNKPWLCIIGNHDCLGSGDTVFKKMFGSLNFAFNAADIRIICLNTNYLEFDQNTPVPDFEFIKQQKNKYTPQTKRTIVCMHSQPYNENFNNNVAEIFQEKLKEYPGLMFCINGHKHSLEQIELFDDGIIYYHCPCIKDRQFYIFDIKEGGKNEYQWKVINY